jgi:hypothetical protein
LNNDYHILWRIPGIRDSFGSALWALDYGLQMAYSNFSNTFLHIGGQNVYYNVRPPLRYRLSATPESNASLWDVAVHSYVFIGSLRCLAQ